MNMESGDVKELAGKLRTFVGADAVFSKPVQVGNYTLITAAELAGGMGLGGGQGTGPVMEAFGDAESIGDEESSHATVKLAESQEHEPAENEDTEPENGTPLAGEGLGAGLGGVSRPVGVIIVGEDDVWVEPIIDKTRMGIAVATTVAAMGVALLRILVKSK